MDAPFIKLFRSPNAYYFYDVGCDEILRIDEKTYAYLDGVLFGAVVASDEDVLRKIEALQICGYLSAKRPSVIKHPYSDIMPLLLERKIDGMTLQITQDCNLRCKYCVYSEVRTRSSASIR